MKNVSSNEAKRTETLSRAYKALPGLVLGLGGSLLLWKEWAGLAETVRSVGLLTALACLAQGWYAFNKLD